MNSNRDKILEKIKEGTCIPSQIPSADVDFEKQIVAGLESVTPKGSQALVDQFKNEFELVSGEFHLIRDVDEAAEWISQFLLESETKKLAITGKESCKHIAEKIIQKNGEIELVEAKQIGWPERKTILSDVSVALLEASFAIANIGSLVFQCDRTLTSLPHFLSECVIAIVDKRQLLANQYDLLEKISAKEMKNMFIVTGPSRTADIEKVLILGAHGPKRVIVLMLDS